MQIGGNPNALIPGPEGVDARVYGVQDVNPSASNNQLAVISQTAEGTKISQRTYEESVLGIPTTGRLEFVLSDASPYTPTVRQNHYVPATATSPYSALNFLMEIQRPQFWDVNKRGDPLGVRGANEIIWYSWETQPIETATQITWTKYGAYLTPVDFIVQLSCRDAIDGSWGYTENLKFWLALDTIRWYNAFSQPIQPSDATPEGAVIQSYQYKGAFPVFAWISAWDPFVVENANGQNVPQIPPEMDGYTQISPSIAGRQLPLYTSPTTLYNEILSSDVWANPSLITGMEQKPNMPDPRFAETVFTPITLTKFGALKQWGGWGPWYWEAYYYPTVFIRVRLLYLTWGQWTYLWTKQEAEQQNYQFENRTSTIIIHESAWDSIMRGLGQIFSNPLFWIGAAFFGILAVIVILAIFAPGVLVAATAASRKRSE